MFAVAPEHPPAAAVRQETEGNMARASLGWAGLVGFGLGGFFDGILLHQVLQWHHLLSLVPGVDDLRAQVLWDGLFHVLMYVLAGAGLWGLLRAHRAGRLPGAQALAGAALLGFAAWQGVDLVVFHWLLEIHHIRVDVPNPVAWDLGWGAVFGVLPALAGWALLRRPGQGGGGGGATFASLAALALVGGAWSARVPDGPFAVVFRPGAGLPAVLAALDAADARLVAGDPHAGFVVVDAEPGRRWAFYAHGAILVGGAGLPAGCVAWSRA
jgi:uncharacterized membrane protein